MGERRGGHGWRGAARGDSRAPGRRRPFTAAGRTFATGTAIVRVAENPTDLAKTLGAIAAKHGAEVVPFDSGWVDSGISLGSSDVVPLKTPRIALAWDAPTQSLSAGWARYVLERRYGLTVSAVRVATLGRFDLRETDVLILPQGNYSGAINDDGVRRLREWIRAGGTLVTIGEASRWAASEKVGLLEARSEMRDGKPEGGDEKDKDKDKDKKSGDSSGPFNYEKAILPERERPENTPGAVLRVALDTEHWLASGTDGAIQAIVEGQRVFTPGEARSGDERRRVRHEGSSRRVGAGVGRSPRPAGAEGVSRRAAHRRRAHHRLRRGPELSRVRRGDRAPLHQRRAAGTAHY